MGTFAETAIVDYRFSFSNPKLPFSVSIFSKQTEFPFPFPICNRQTGSLFSVCGIRKTWTWRDGEWRHQREIGGQTVFLNPFTIYLSCKRRFAFCPCVDAETNGKLSACKQTKRNCPSTVVGKLLLKSNCVTLLPLL
jgi:hypothetical protein